MSEYSDLKRMIEDLVVERDGWKRSCEAANAHWASTRERDEFNRCEAHLRGRKISKLQQELRQAKEDLVKAERMCESLRKDADRYRWLRRNEVWDDACDEISMKENIWIVESREEVINRTGDDLDRSIDFMMDKK